MREIGRLNRQSRRFRVAALIFVVGYIGLLFSEQLAIAIPSLLTCCLAMLIAGPLFSRHYRLVWHAHHVCPECGYDMRASPERCPECGYQVTQNDPL